NVVRESQLVINNDPEVSCCFGWNKRHGVNIDIDVVVDDMFGWEDHQFSFGQVQLKVVIFHPCGYISKTVRDPRRERGVLRRERQTHTHTHRFSCNPIHTHTHGFSCNHTHTQSHIHALTRTHVSSLSVL